MATDSPGLTPWAVSPRQVRRLLVRAPAQFRTVFETFGLPSVEGGELYLDWADGPEKEKGPARCGPLKASRSVRGGLYGRFAVTVRRSWAESPQPAARR